MKRIYIVTDVYPNPGGDSVFILPELKELQKKYKITVLCASARQASAVLEEGIEYYFFDLQLAICKKIFYTVTFFLHAACLQETWDIMKNGARKPILGQLLKSVEFYACEEEFYSFLHKNISNWDKNALFYTFWYKYYALSMCIHPGNNGGLMTRLHGADLYQERYEYGRQPFKKYMNTRMDRLYFAAALPREYYLETYPGLFPEKTEVRRLGVFPIQGKAERKEGTPFLLLSCSNVIPLKRVEWIAEALALVGMPVRWVHFGDGISMDKLRLVLAQKLSDRPEVQAELRGNVDNEAVRRFYEENYVDCFITVSSTEGGSPVSVMEAMAAGVPVIGTPVGDIPFMIRENGILLPPDPSVRDIADAIIRIMKTDAAGMKIMRMRSLQLWKEHFDARVNAAEFARSVEGFFGDE